MKIKNFLFILLCIAFTALFVWMGVWQLQRLSWKQEIISDYETKKNLPFAEFDKNISEDKNYWKYRKVHINGTAYPSQSFRITGKLVGREKGVHVVLPVRLVDGSVVFVMQGSAPLGWVDEHQNQYPISVNGLFVEYFGPKFSFLPNNMPQENFWLWADVSEFTKKLNNDLQDAKTFPLVLKLIDENAKMPKPLEADLEFRNDHLGYAITWLSLAVVMVVMTIIYIKRI